MDHGAQGRDRRPDGHRARQPPQAKDVEIDALALKASMELTAHLSFQQELTEAPPREPPQVAAVRHYEGLQHGVGTEPPWLTGGLTAILSVRRHEEHQRYKLAMTGLEAAAQADDNERAATEIARALQDARSVAQVQAMLAAAPEGVASQTLAMGWSNPGIWRNSGDRVVVRDGLQRAGRKRALFPGEVATVLGEGRGQHDLILHPLGDRSLGGHFDSADLATWVGGQLLHHAAVSGCSAEVLEIILAADPTVANIVDGEGKVPLQRAVDCGCNAQILSLLHAAVPQKLLDVTQVAVWLGSVAQTEADVKAIFAAAPDGIVSHWIQE
eukprot:COSAG02_NODE_3542_length_6588_cov_7.145015_1_plen_326_part_10